MSSYIQYIIHYILIHYIGYIVNDVISKIVHYTINKKWKTDLYVDLCVP